MEIGIQIFEYVYSIEDIYFPPFLRALFKCISYCPLHVFSLLQPLQTTTFTDVRGPHSQSYGGMHGMNSFTKDHNVMKAWNAQ